MVPGVWCFLFQGDLRIRMASVLLDPYAGREGRLRILCGVAPFVQPQAFSGAAS